VIGDPRPTDDESTPARRPWFRLHRSTYAVLVVLVIVVTLLNVPGQLVVSPQFYSDGAKCGYLSVPWEYFDHGWPLVYLRRDAECLTIPSSFLVGQVAWRSIWSLTRDVEEFDGFCLTIDFVVASIVLALGVAIYETWRRRRKLLQLHLIDLFLLITVAAGVLAWLSTEAREYRKEQQSLAKLEHETYLYTEPGGPTWVRKLIGERPFRIFDRVVDMGEGIDGIAGSFRHLKRLTSAPAGDLSCLGQLPRLEAIELAREAIDDSQLVHLRHCGRLKGLNLYGVDVTDEGIVHLASVPTLQYLELTRTQISDDGLAHLAGLPELRVLCLLATGITDDGLSHLEALGSLEFLDLSYTRVTEAGIENLRKALPGCRIVHEPIPPPPEQAPSD